MSSSTQVSISSFELKSTCILFPRRFYSAKSLTCVTLQ